MRPLSSTPARRRLALALLLLAMLVFSFKAAPRSTTSDFRRYWTAGRAVLDGEDIYAAEGVRQFKYLPVFALCMTPFAALDEPAEFARRRAPGPAEAPASVWVWYAVVAGSYLGLLALTLRLALPGAAARRRWAVGVGVVVLLVTGRFFVDNARLGQINLPVAFLALAGAWHVGRGREGLGGLLTALGACLKFMPAVLILWYLWQRRWRAALWGVLGIVLFLFVVPAAVFGWQGNLRLLEGYVERRSKMVTTVPKADAPGQSVPAMLNRLLRPVRAGGLHDDGAATELRINVAALSRGTVNLLAGLAVGLLVLLGLWATRPPPGEEGPPPPWRWGLDVGLVLILMLLVSPEARRAHFVTLVLPAGMLAAAALRGGPRARLAAGALIAAGVLILGTSSDLIGDLASAWAAATGCVLVGTLALAAGLLALKRAGPPADAAAAPPGPREAPDV